MEFRRVLFRSGDRDRRHRIDPRRVPCRAPHRPRRYARALVRGRHHAAVHGALARAHRRPGARLDADLSADGARPALPSRRALSREGALTMADLAAPMRPAAARPGWLGGNALPVVMFAAFAAGPPLAPPPTGAAAAGL